MFYFSETKWIRKLLMKTNINESSFRLEFLFFRDYFICILIDFFMRFVKLECGIVDINWGAGGWLCENQVKDFEFQIIF